MRKQYTSAIYLNQEVLYEFKRNAAKTKKETFTKMVYQRYYRQHYPHSIPILFGVRALSSRIQKRLLFPSYLIYSLIRFTRYYRININKKELSSFSLYRVPFFQQLSPIGF